MPGPERLAEFCKRGQLLRGKRGLGWPRRQAQFTLPGDAARGGAGFARRGESKTGAAGEA